MARARRAPKTGRPPAVVPLAVFYLLGGTLLLTQPAFVVFGSLRDTSDLGLEVMGLLGLLCAAIGTGYLLRWRLAWRVSVLLALIGVFVIAVVLWRDVTFEYRLWRWAEGDYARERSLSDLLLATQAYLLAIVAGVLHLLLLLTRDLAAWFLRRESPPRGEEVES